MPSQESDDPTSFELLEKGDGYVMPSSALGKTVTFGKFSKHSKYIIPPNVNVMVLMKTGGSYGFARSDINDTVIESCSNANCNYYTLYIVQHR